MSAHIDPSAALPRCLVCKLCITSEPVLKRYKGQPVELHATCWHSIEQQPIELRAFAEGRLVPIKASLPAFAVLPSSVEFRERVTSPRLIAAAERFVPDAHGCLGMIGPAGCGKTITAAAIVLGICAKAVTAYVRDPKGARPWLDFAARIYWTTAAELCASRRQHRLGEGEAPTFQRAETAPLLVLDEVGQEIGDDRWLLELLDVRYSRGLPTLSTSGLPRTELERRYGTGAVRRLVEPKGQFLDLFSAAKGG